MNYSELPLDCRRIIVSFVNTTRSKKSTVILKGELDRWRELKGIVDHTILNGPGGETVERQARNMIAAACLQVERDLNIKRWADSVDELLLRCKPSSAQQTDSTPRTTTKDSSSASSEPPIVPKECTPITCSVGPKQ
jgi:hypothetical protein